MDTHLLVSGAVSGAAGNAQKHLACTMDENGGCYVPGPFFLQGLLLHVTSVVEEGVREDEFDHESWKSCTCM